MTTTVRKPEPWESNAAAPFLTIGSPRGEVSVQSLGQERFRVSTSGHEHEVLGFEAARSTAHVRRRNTAAVCRGSLRSWRKPTMTPASFSCGTSSSHGRRRPVLENKRFNEAALRDENG